jgi:hypothetical protein
MGFRLRSGLSFCLAQGKPIFLDTVADRYFTLTVSGERSFLQLVSSEDSQTPPDELTGLARSGVIEGAGHDLPPLPCPLPPMAHETMLDAPRSSLDLVQFFAATIELARVSAMLKRGRFHALIEDLRRRKARLAKADPPSASALRVAAAFVRTAYWSSPHDRCLPRSIAVARRLIAMGYRPDLVIAVQVQPFRAHCWVQYKNQLVNDRRETVEAFIPILLV